MASAATTVKWIERKRVAHFLLLTVLFAVTLTFCLFVGLNTRARGYSWVLLAAGMIAITVVCGGITYVAGATYLGSPGSRQSGDRRSGMSRAIVFADTVMSWVFRYRAVLVTVLVVTIIVAQAKSVSEYERRDDSSLRFWIPLDFGVPFGIFAAAILTHGDPALVAAVGKMMAFMTWMFIVLVWGIAMATRACGELARLLGQFLLLVPLSVLFLITRFVQVWRGIFYTCPSRRCSYRGLPAHVCPHCHEINDKLWPNLYGVFWHHCAKCDKKLPTLDLLGRKHLQRCCGHKDCRMPLMGRHAGRAPERLAAIVGGVDSAKTCYLHMAVHQIVQGNGESLPIHGSIDDPEQERAFHDAWGRLRGGGVPNKTVDVTHAYILHAEVRGKRCQLYLYDAPGEEFGSLSAMSRQQYFPLIEGFLLLVDPLSLVELGGSKAATRMRLETVVSSMLSTAIAGMTPGPGGKFPQRVAVVISKADFAPVRARIGDIQHEPARSEVCRRALCDWGQERLLRLIEQKFAHVRYFACSPLGRSYEAGNREPFSGHRVLDPLLWILEGRH